MKKAESQHIINKMNNPKIAVILMIGSSLVLACGNKQQQQTRGTQAIPVSTAVVGEELVTGMKTYPGNVVALNETELRA